MIVKSGLRELLVSKSQFCEGHVLGEEMKRCETRIRPARDPKQQGTEEKDSCCALLAGCKYREAGVISVKGFTHSGKFCERLPTLRSASKHSLMVVSLGYQSASAPLNDLAFSLGYSPSSRKASGSSARQSAPHARSQKLQPIRS